MDGGALEFEGTGRGGRSPWRSDGVASQMEKRRGGRGGADGVGGGVRRAREQRGGGGGGGGEGGVCGWGDATTQREKLGRMEGAGRWGRTGRGRLTHGGRGCGRADDRENDVPFFFWYVHSF